jgi:hypothetical protein
LRYIDLSKKGAGKYYQAGNIFEQVSMRGDRTPADHQNQGPVITRMTIGSDGYGYGLSNDAQTFFRFTTGKDVQVQELGPLVDDDANGSLSVHNRCSGGWGGDMVAGADGKLYLITNTLSVFSIEPETRLATHIGRIKGLPGDFIVNGAAVNDDGQVVLSNATIAGKFGLVTDFGNLQGKLIEQAEWLNASDLASANLLFQSQSTAKTIDPLPERKTTDDGIGIFPNPVTNGRVLISFDKVGPGDYTIDLVTGTGNIAMRKPVRITTKGQQVEMNVNAMAKGFYSVRVVNGQKRDVASAKLVIQ